MERFCVTQVPAIREEKDDNHCHHISKQFPCITFSPEDMQVKRKHDRPLYYTVHWIIWSELYSGWSEIRVERHAPLGHTTFEDPRPPVKCHSDNHLWFQCQWYAADRKNQTQVSNWGLEIWGDVSLTLTPRTIRCWDDLRFTVMPSSHPLFIK